MKTSPVLVMLFCLCPLAGRAIVTANNTTAATDPSGINGFNWDYVYNYKGSSAVAVDSYWLLTAAHVANDGGTGALTIDGVTYNQQEIVYNGSADLALVRYDKALPGYYSLYTGALHKNQSIVMVGYGNTGTVSSASWTDSGRGSGVERWGSQQIDSTTTIAYNADGSGVTTNSGFWMGFNLGGTSYEAGAAVHDSGGGTFYNNNGIWELAGINTVLSGDGNGNYNATFSVATGNYSSWITQTIPEPTTAIMLAGVAVVFGIIKRVRYMYQ